MGEISKRTGERIRFLRGIKKLSLQELADRVHKSKSTLSKYENGEIVMDVETLCEIAEALEVSPRRLLDLPVSAQKEEARRFYPQILTAADFTEAAQIILDSRRGNSSQF